MKMDKKIVISIICLVLVIVLFVVIWNLVVAKSDLDSEKNLNVNESENVLNISEFEVVTDECVIEEDDAEDVSNNLNDDSTRYLLKNVNGYIYVYYLTNDNEAYLYKKTTIAIDYLSQEDMDDLEIGIEVVGTEELNKALEDFE